MPGSVAAYAYSHGQVSSMAEGLLPMDSLMTLIENADSAHTENILHRAHLPLELAQGSYTPALIEQAFVSVIAAELQRLARGVSGAGRALLRHWIGRFDLINIKVLLRNKAAGVETPPEALLDMTPCARLPLDRLIHSEDVPELLRLLGETAYAEMARHARRVYEEKHDTFDVETSLERTYFTGLIKGINLLSGDERLRLHPLTGNIIDRINLIWLLRFRLNYSLAPPQTYYLLLPAGRYLHRRELLGLAQLDSLEAILGALPEPLRHRTAGCNDINAVEAALEAETHRLALHTLHTSSFNLARLFAYLILREQQLMLMHVIFKGRHLQLPPEVIRSACGCAGLAGMGG